MEAANLTGLSCRGVTTMVDANEKSPKGVHGLPPQSIHAFPCAPIAAGFLRSGLAAQNAQGGTIEHEETAPQ